MAVFCMENINGDNPKVFLMVIFPMKVKLRFFHENKVFSYLNIFRSNYFLSQLSLLCPTCIPRHLTVLPVCILLMEVQTLNFPFAIISHLLMLSLGPAVFISTSKIYSHLIESKEAFYLGNYIRIERKILPINYPVITNKITGKACVDGKNSNRP